jgi:hypothetical protein
VERPAVGNAGSAIKIVSNRGTGKTGNPPRIPSRHPHPGVRQMVSHQAQIRRFVGILEKTRCRWVPRGVMWYAAPGRTQRWFFAILIQ